MEPKERSAHGAVSGAAVGSMDGFNLNYSQQKKMGNRWINTSSD
jgi:hypothetical protein